LKQIRRFSRLCRIVESETNRLSLPRWLEKIAEVRGVSVADVATASTENFIRFFALQETAANSLHQRIR